MDAALREIPVALLEADVHFRVVKRPQGHGSSTLPVRTTESI
jgi:hypothetical protein